jgi:hypothetical protein
MRGRCRVGVLACCLGAMLAWGAQVGAQVAAPAPASQPNPVAVAAGSLGTLLLTPKQREELGLARQIAAKYQSFAPDGTPIDFSIPKDIIGSVPAATPTLSDGTPTSAQIDPTNVVDPNLMVNGVVIRQGNKSTIWVNGVPVYGRSLADPDRQRMVKAGVVKDDPKGFVLEIKPGQTLNTESGQRTDLLPDGAVKIIRPSAAVPRLGNGQTKK